jgi:ABC-type transporter Mla MlaB component
MYANGRIDDAQRLLQQAIDADEGERPWHLLLGLYRIEGDWKSFASLAARFERRFQRGAPTWLNEEAFAHLPLELHPGGESYCALEGALDRRSAAKLESLAQRHSGLHIDASKIARVDDEGCRYMAQLLAALRDNGNAVVLTGAERLTALLRQALDADGGQIYYWTLLLELLRLGGQQAEFQRTALEYALATGASPPEWQPVLMPVLASVSVTEKRDEPRYEAGPQANALSGVVLAGNPQLESLLEFAAARQYVNVNLAQVSRMDCAGAVALTRLANELVQAGKVVRLIRPNALVATLLAMLELDPRVQLIEAG